MNAMSMKLIGSALLWLGLAALVYTPTSAVNVPVAAVSAIGFLSFAFGLLVFSHGQKKAIVSELQQGPSAGGHEA